MNATQTAFYTNPAEEQRLKEEVVRSVLRRREKASCATPV